MLSRVSLQKRKERQTSFSLFFVFPYGLHAVTLLETVYTPAGVNQLLLAGKIRMALGTNFNAQILLGRTGLEGIAANTGHGRLLILGMNALFHDFHLSRRNTIT